MKKKFLANGFLLSLCCATACVITACAGDPQDQNIVTQSTQQPTSATNGPQWNGPQWNGPQLNGPQLNGPQWNGPQLNGPQWNGATDMGQTLLWGNSFYHDTWVNNPFNETTLLDPGKLKDVLCSLPDSVVLHYIWSLAYDSSKTASFSVHCVYDSVSGVVEGDLIYNLAGASNLAPSWYSSALMAKGSSTCGTDAAFLSAGWLSALNSAPSRNRTESYGNVIHNPYSLRGTQGESAHLVGYINQTSTYFYGVESVSATGAMPAGSTYSTNPDKGWRPGGVFRATGVTAGTTLKICVTGNSSGTPVVLGLAQGLHMADYSATANGGIYSVDGRYSNPQTFSSPSASATSLPCLTTQALPAGDQVFGYSYRAYKEAANTLLNTTTLTFNVTVATGSATIQMREHQMLPWREGAFWGCLFGSTNRNTSKLGFINNITSNNPFLLPCVESPGYYCGTYPGPKVSKCSSVGSTSVKGLATSCATFVPPASGSVSYFGNANVCVTSGYSNAAQYAQARGCTNAVFNTGATVCYMTPAYAPCETACYYNGYSSFTFSSPYEFVSLGDFKYCRPTSTSGYVAEVLTTYLGSKCASVNLGTYQQPSCF